MTHAHKDVAWIARKFLDLGPRFMRSARIEKIEKLRHDGKIWVSTRLEVPDEDVYSLIELPYADDLDETVRNLAEKQLIHAVAQTAECDPGPCEGVWKGSLTGEDRKRIRDGFSLSFRLGSADMADASREAVRRLAETYFREASVLRVDAESMKTIFCDFVDEAVAKIVVEG